MSWYIREGIHLGKEAYAVTNQKGESYWFQTYDWAELCKSHFDRLDLAVAKKITYTNGVWESTVTTNSIRNGPAPGLSEWKCHLFGSNGELTLVVPKGEEPNWFWRKMQYIAFGNKWFKTKQ